MCKYERNVIFVDVNNLISYIFQMVLSLNKSCEIINNQQNIYYSYNEASLSDRAKTIYLEYLYKFKYLYKSGLYFN